jgi:Cu/Ag efflux protein CusF
MKGYIVSTIAVATLIVGLTLPARAETAPSLAAAASERQAEETFTGTISKIDQAARTMAVKGATGSKTFQLAANVEVVIGDKPQAALSDLQAGETVNVSYTKEGTTLMAHRIEVSSGATK